MTQRDMLRYVFHRPLRRALAWVFAIFSPLAFSSCETQNQPTKQGQLTGRIGPRCEPQQQTVDRSFGEPFPQLTGMVAAAGGSVSLVRIVRANNPHFSVNGPASGKFAFIKRERRDTDEAGIIIGMLFQE
jgi:hypothetical protein